MRARRQARDVLTADQRADLAALVPVADGNPEKVPRFIALRCPWCGGAHSMSCPRVKRLVYGPSGQVAEVEFFAEADWSKTDIVFAVDVWPAGEGESP